MDKNLLKLVVDHYNGAISGNFSNDDQKESIRQALIELNGGSDKLDYRAIRDGKANGLFAFIEETINKIVLEGYPDDLPLYNYVDMRNVAKGDSPVFKIVDDSLFVVANIADGTQALRRQRIKAGSSEEVKTQLKGIKIYEELSRVLAGRVDFNELIQRVADSFKSAINEAMYKAVVAAIRGVAAPYKQTGTFAEAKLQLIIDHVEAATGKTAIVLGSKQAVRKITNITGADAHSAKEDLYAMGYFGHIGENPIISLKNMHEVGTDTFILPDDKLFVIATDEKFIKFVTEGETYVIVGDPNNNSDLSQEYTVIQQYGVATVLSDKGLGVYEL